jgi:hypothetical protein
MQQTQPIIDEKFLIYVMLHFNNKQNYAYVKLIRVTTQKKKFLCLR